MSHLLLLPSSLWFCSLMSGHFYYKELLRSLPDPLIVSKIYFKNRKTKNKKNNHYVLEHPLSEHKLAYIFITVLIACITSTNCNSFSKGITPFYSTSKKILKYRLNYLLALKY